LAKKQITEEITPLKYNKNSVFFKMKHWQVVDGDVKLMAGGIFFQEDYEKVHEYFKSKGLI